MNPFIQGLQWIFTPSHWVQVDGGAGIGAQLLAHLQYTFIALFFVFIIAVPIGLLIGHTGKGRAVAITASNIARALPTLGLLAVLILLLGIGIVPTTIVLVILGIPPLLAGVYAGVESVDRQTIDAARALGMTEWQILFQVEIPLSIALLIGGLRAATLQIVATVAIASVYGGNGLGNFVVSGVAQNNFAKAFGGAILVIVLALVIDGIYAIIQRFVVPRGVSRRANDSNTTARGGSIPVVAPTRTPLTEGQ